MNGRHTNPGDHHRSRLVVITVAAMVVAAVALFGVGYRQLGLSNDLRQSSPPATTLTSAARGTPAACVAVSAAQRKALASADTAILQWQAHIAAMTALFAGRTPFDQAMRDWDRRRTAIDASMAAFSAADAEYRRLIGRHGPCSGENNAGEALLLEARQSVSRWSSDIKDAKDLRAERISCPAAMKKWMRTDVQRMSELARYEGARAVYNASTPLAARSGMYDETS